MDSYFCTWSYWICICRSSFQMQAGSRGLMDRVGLVTWRLRVRVSGQAGIVGRESECTALSSTILSKHRTPNYSPGAVAIWLPAAPGVCSLLCVHLDGLNAEHTFQVWDGSPYLATITSLSQFIGGKISQTILSVKWLQLLLLGGDTTENREHVVEGGGSFPHVFIYLECQKNTLYEYIIWQAMLFLICFRK